MLIRGCHYHPAFGESARFHLSDYRLVAWHNFLFARQPPAIDGCVQRRSGLKSYRYGFGGARKRDIRCVHPRHEQCCSCLVNDVHAHPVRLLW